MDRYKRQTNLPEIGESGQQKLTNAKVLVVGAGGLGCAVLPYLTAGGIGTLGIIDGDKVDISNLHRQVLYTEESVGKPKVEEASKYIRKQNSETKIKTHNEFLTPKNAFSTLEDYDVVIDATDNLPTRYLINDACVLLNKPFVYGSVYRHEGQVSVFNYKNGPTYRCLFKENNSKPVNCEEAGTLGTTVALIGMLQANEVIKIILETGDILSGKLLIYNTLKNYQNIINFKKDKSLEVDFDFYKKEHLEKISNNMTAEEALNSNRILIDVRELDETPFIQSDDILQLPLSQLESDVSTLDKNKKYAIFCQHGIRSKIAINMLKKHHFKHVKNITDGAQTIYNLIEHGKEKSIY